MPTGFAAPPMARFSTRCTLSGPRADRQAAVFRRVNLTSRAFSAYQHGLAATGAMPGTGEDMQFGQQSSAASTFIWFSRFGGPEVSRRSEC